MKRKTKGAVLTACFWLLSHCPTLAADADFDAGLKAYKAGNYAKAAESFEKALKKSQKDPNTWYYCALCYHQQKNWPVARSRYRTLAKYFPETSAGKQAIAALKTLDPTFVAPTSAATATSGTGTSAPGTPAKAASKSNDDEEMDDEEKEKLEKELAKLPDKAHFYFKKGPQGHMEVDLMVNGHPVKAEFDTGASAFFYADQLKEAGLDLNKSTKGAGTMGWAGKKVETTEMPAKVTLGTLTRNIRIVMQESTSHSGHNLIGQDFIKGYQYEIDDNGGRVDLKKNLDMKASEINPLYDIPLTNKGKDDYIPIQINGKKVMAFIDTGAFATVISAAEANRLGIQTTGEVQGLEGVGGSVEMQKAVVEIRIGGLQKQGFSVLIGGSGGCAIGQDLMSGWRYKVDRKNKLLRFFH